MIKTASLILVFTAIILSIPADISAQGPEDDEFYFLYFDQDSIVSATKSSKSVHQVVDCRFDYFESTLAAFVARH